MKPIRVKIVIYLPADLARIIHNAAKACDLTFSRWIEIAAERRLENPHG